MVLDFAREGNLFKREGEGFGSDELTSKTKEFWTTADASGFDENTGTYLADAFTGGASTAGFMIFKVPNDFTEIVTAEIICFTVDGNQTDKNVDIGATYGQIGEDWNNHSETDLATTHSFTNNKLTAINISGVLTNLAANDFVEAKIGNNDFATFDLLVLGFRLRYN